MRIALLSDIHANLAAWNAVLADTAVHQVDKIICLGDIVGYGPQPAQVLSSAYANVDYFALGNHDAAAAGLIKPVGFNPTAQKIILRTREMLDERARRFIANFPLRLNHPLFTASHGSSGAPDRFSYLINKADAAAEWKRTSEHVICVGHTHVPRLHVLAPSGRYRRFEGSERPVKLKDDHRYIVNCGSVGLPRDNDFRAGYVILDTGAQTVCWQRLSYDLDTFRSAVNATYSDPELSGFLLDKIDRHTRRPVRELIDFTPGDSALSGKVTGSKEITEIKARIRRWKTATAVIVLLLMILLVSAFRFWTNTPQHRTIGDPTGPVLHARAQAGNWEHDYLGAGLGPRAPLPPGWQAVLSDARRQEVSCTPGRLHVVSRSRRPLDIHLPAIGINDIGRIRWDINGTVGDTWSGRTPELVLSYKLLDGSVAEGTERIALRRDEKNLFRTHTVTSIPEGSHAVLPQISLRGEGSFSISTLQATFSPTEQKKLLLAGPLDINHASRRDLKALPGIGPALADRIVEYRTENDGFGSIDQLLEVHGIGERRLEEMKKYLK